MKIRFIKADENAHDALFKHLQEEGFNVDKVRMDRNFNLIEFEGRTVIDQRDSNISLIIQGEPTPLEKQAFAWLDQNAESRPAERRNDWFYALFACAGWLIIRSPSVLETEPSNLGFLGGNSFTAAVVLLVLNLLTIALFVLAYIHGRRKSRQAPFGQAFIIRKNPLFWAGMILVTLLFYLFLQAPMYVIPFLSIAPVFVLGVALLAFRKGRLLHNIETLKPASPASA